MFVAIHTGPVTHLDHLAPLCYLLKIPLIVTEKEHEKMGKQFYPMIEIRYVNLLDLSLEYIANNFCTILTCGKFWAMELGPLVEMFYGKKIRFIFSPHGYSDKESFLNIPIPQMIQLLYGPQTLAKNTHTHSIIIGNIRHWFYKKFKTHFDAFVQPFFSTKKKTVLYAPTWETKATHTSFFAYTTHIIAPLKQKYHLLIKPHPLLEENHPGAFHKLLSQHEHETQFILNFPLVFPLLEKTNYYLGDFSSVGYDFLLYDRPMFFLEKGGLLQQCGQQCGELFTGKIQAQTKLSCMRRQTYNNIFAKCEPRQIKTLLKKFFSPTF